LKDAQAQTIFGGETGIGKPSSGFQAIFEKTAASFTSSVRVIGLAIIILMTTDTGGKLRIIAQHLFERVLEKGVNRGARRLRENKLRDCNESKNKPGHRIQANAGR
jgi:hypothetical protein